jgi:hypothetical protein
MYTHFITDMCASHSCYFQVIPMMHYNKDIWFKAKWKTDSLFELSISCHVDHISDPNRSTYELVTALYTTIYGVDKMVIVRC